MVYYGIFTFFLFSFLLSFHSFSFNCRTSTLITSQMKNFMQKNKKKLYHHGPARISFFTFFSGFYFLFQWRGGGAKSVPSARDDTKRRYAKKILDGSGWAGESELKKKV